MNSTKRLLAPWCLFAEARYGHGLRAPRSVAWLTGRPRLSRDGTPRLHATRHHQSNPVDQPPHPITNNPKPTPHPIRPSLCPLCLCGETGLTRSRDTPAHKPGTRWHRLSCLCNVRTQRASTETLDPPQATLESATRVAGRAPRSPVARCNSKPDDPSAIFRGRRGERCEDLMWI